jgi:hypothetical protein
MMTVKLNGPATFNAGKELAHRRVAKPVGDIRGAL